MVFKNYICIFKAHYKNINSFMRNLKPLKLLTLGIFSMVMVTDCSNDELSVQEDVNSASKIKTSNLSRLQSLDVTSSKTKATYFLEQLEAGNDIRAELYLDISENYNPVADSDDARFNKDLILSAINPDEYACDSSDIALTNYINSTTADWTLTEIIYYVYFGDYPQYDAIYFKAIGEPQTYGINGQFTNQLNRTFKDLKRFWDINSDDINMFAMKGTTYADFERTLEIEMALYPSQTLEESQDWVRRYQAVFGSDLYWNYNHPLLSFNAFALSTSVPFIEDRIVMGDGILAGFEAIGLGDVAPQAILAHEYAHQIQFENGYFVDVAPEDQPAATRRTELMADAYAAYYLSHKKGATMNWWRIEQFMQTFYNIGDCSVSQYKLFHI